MNIPPDLQNVIDGYAGEGAAYASGQGISGTDTGAAVTQDYATGAGVVNSTYQGTGGDLQNMTASASGILAGLSVLGNPKSSIADDAKATALIVSGVEGAITAVTAVALTTGLVTFDAVASAVPVVGLIAAVAVTVAAAVIVIIQKLFGASAGQITTTSEDQARELIWEVYRELPTAPLPKAAFTDSSRTLAGLLAAYANAMMSPSGKTRCVASNPQGFEYQCYSTGAIHALIAQMLGSDATKADEAISLVSVLWDPRWQGNGNTNAADPAYFVLGTADDLDPYGGGLTVYIENLAVVKPITDKPGLSGASYLCEIAAAAYLSNIDNPAGNVYAAMYLRLAQIAWLWLVSGLAVPGCILASAGFMLDSAVRNNFSKMLILAPESVQAKSNAGLPSTASMKRAYDLTYWVDHYLAEDDGSIPA